MTPRQQALLHSPPIRVLLGVLIVDAVLGAAVLAWNVGERLLDTIGLKPQD